MAIRVVRENGDEILRKKSRKIEVIDDRIIGRYGGNTSQI